MISVSDALEHLFELANPMETELVSLREAAGRVLAENVTASRTQPPFNASSMDGYALRAAEVEADAMFKVIGEAAAGRSFAGHVNAGQCVRIFTGAPMPEGTDFVVIQEDVERRDNLITLGRDMDGKSNVRPAGGDFFEGSIVSSPRMLGAADVALLAAMNLPQLPVFKRPTVAILATGDELVAPGETPAPDQIIASNSYGLAAQLEGLGASARILPIAKDTQTSLKTALSLTEGADLIVTIGGASVGEYDIVADVAGELGMEQSFYKVAMRPGKPLMAGSLNGVPMIGLPGNPVSSLVCGTIFVRPFVRAMLGLGKAAAPRSMGTLAAPLPKNGPREHYMRAAFENDGLRAFERQDSSLLTVLAGADALLVRPPHDPPQPAGAEIEFIPLR